MKTVEPGAVVLAGDWHGNSGWARHVIGKARELLKREERKIILHAGDFGVWPGVPGRAFLEEVSFYLQLAGFELWFVDGNHEWHPELIALREEELSHGNHGLVPIDRPGPKASIFWIPRGHRWTWHRKTWMGLGGAVSVDAGVRVEGKSWWREETFTGEQLKHATRAGKVHVMLTHDSPSAVRMSFGEPPRIWDAADLARSTAHREQLQDVVDKVQPEMLIHGHYHRDVRQVIEPYGTHVIGLDMDGERGNYTLLDTRDLFEIRPLYQWEEEMNG
jgi:calcineurin-like phosphoesterase family protein